jgi:alpha-N-arabinofuranosidase
MVNVLQAMVLTDGPKMLLTPTYHVFRMFVPFQDATSLPVKLSTAQYKFGKLSVPRTSASAARVGDGSIELALVNLDPDKPARISAIVAGARLRQVAGEVLTATETDAHNTFDDPNAVRPEAFHDAKFEKDGRLAVTLPPKSVVPCTQLTSCSSGNFNVARRVV